MKKICKLKNHGPKSILPYIAIDGQESKVKNNIKATKLKRETRLKSRE